MWKELLFIGILATWLVIGVPLLSEYYRRKLEEDKKNGK